MNLLEQIQALQFTDRPAAETLLKSFIAAQFDLDVQSIELRPLAVSLNSFNGFMTLVDGRRLFFKTHTEPNNVIGEYYNAASLAQAGYPVLQPVMQSTEAGKQFLVYEVIDDPSVFDVAWEIENRRSPRFVELETAQRAADRHLREIYAHTLAEQSAADSAGAPIHQLFYHRLTGGRLKAFYDDDITLVLPEHTLSMREARRLKWTINDQQYEDSLDTIIHRAVELLNPAAQSGASIIGHGDAHNGNVFLRGGEANVSLLYFDPAFAGRHSPLLDLTKPLFHNIFAMWMYFPHVIAGRLNISLTVNEDRLHVTHDYALHPIRRMFLESKVNAVLIPTLRDLRDRGWLRADWRAALKASLFCCPFLTMNLADPAKFPPSIRLLGLSMAVEMGSESGGTRSIIDQTLDEVERAL
ncbi:MAG: hypothetical protein U0670_13555 [Anaerolineae bacterium]